MHFLITNDDGISAPGLRALVDACLEKKHTVTVCAPQTQQSAVSHHLTLDRPLLVRRIPWDGADAYALAGTPADCVRMGQLLCMKPVDFVFSGINNGHNAGTAVYYSGTVAAAREARMCNMESMAVSIFAGADEEMLRNLACMAVSIAEKAHGRGLPRLCLLNLNAPALPPRKLKGLRIAPLSDAFFTDTYERRRSPRGMDYFWLEEGLKIEPHRPGSDMALLEEGHPVLTLVGGYETANSWAESNLQDIFS
ncbi:MAG: 5'/3'-nucleotidase SurE [Clostridia bacterium]|nr:5'/3'-nucleotidase SurE [Clostridia bacterium]